jgi:hypothetical protein
MGISPQEWWPLYFVSDVYDARDRRADLAQQLITYFSSADGFYWVEQARGSPLPACVHAAAALRCCAVR